MRDLICRALYGALRLATALAGWLSIAARLTEAPRRRRPQRVAVLPVRGLSGSTAQAARRRQHGAGSTAARRP